ncbi:MAG: chromate resistance protein ChrB domain-containing protein [Xanthobacteraceae bacterium]|uniref:chromate resistance protein ChrB domain-containing protein n=1 Tax=Pseudolabrys sp. TaxID=1960880 RepID=UPI003D1405D9
MLASSLASPFFVTPQQLWHAIGTPNAPVILDVRRREVYDGSDAIIPTARWCAFDRVASWSEELDPSTPIVIACKAGHELSQSTAAHLRAAGFRAGVLHDGYAGWVGAGLPTIAKAPLDRLAPQRPSLWVTRRRPKIDRIACPWLIRRFLDREARVLFVDPPEVAATARETGATPFDIEGVELSHDGERCSFDTMLRLFGLESDLSLTRLALIVRGADTARPDIAPEAAGLHAVSLGLSALAGDDDHGLLRNGFLVYDGLFAWLRHAAAERHNWPAKAA